MDNTKALKIIAIRALQALFSGDNQPTLKIRDNSDIRENYFELTIWEPKDDDSGDADEPFLSVVVEVEAVDDEEKRESGEFDCKVISFEIINNPEDKNLSNEFRHENITRKIREQRNETDEN